MLTPSLNRNYSGAFSRFWPEMRYYNPAIHTAAFALPQYLQEHWLHSRPKEKIRN